jgi:hypothetical protein
MMMLLEICSNMEMITSVQLATIVHLELGYLLNVWQAPIQIQLSAIGHLHLEIAHYAQSTTIVL